MPYKIKFQGSLLAEGALKWNQCYTQLELELALGLICTSLYNILWILFASVSHPYKYNICHILFDRKNLFPTQNQFTHSYLWKQTVSDTKYHMLTFFRQYQWICAKYFSFDGVVGVQLIKDISAEVCDTQFTVSLKYKESESCFISKVTHWPKAH